MQIYYTSTSNQWFDQWQDTIKDSGPILSCWVYLKLMNWSTTPKRAAKVKLLKSSALPSSESRPPLGSRTCVWTGWLPLLGALPTSHQEHPPVSHCLHPPHWLVLPGESTPALSTPCHISLLQACTHAILSHWKAALPMINSSSQWQSFLPSPSASSSMKPPWTHIRKWCDLKCTLLILFFSYSSWM